MRKLMSNCRNAKVIEKWDIEKNKAKRKQREIKDNINKIYIEYSTGLY